jgi:histidine triad (HIT) family protein
VNPDCLFCRIVAGEERAERVDEDELTFSFMDASPASNGHTLVIPKTHLETIYDLEQPHADAVWRTTLRLAHAIRSGLKPEGLMLRQANGTLGGQHVMHLHMHLIPRYASGDRGEPGRTGEFAATIRNELA